MKPWLYKISTEWIPDKILSQLLNERDIFSVGACRSNIFITISDTSEQIYNVLSLLPEEKIQLMYEHEYRTEYPWII